MFSTRLHITAYDTGGDELTTGSGTILCRARREVVQIYYFCDGTDDNFAVIFRLPRSRFIVGHSFGAGFLFRGELIQTDEKEARYQARVLTEQMIETDYENQKWGVAPPN